MKTNKQKLIDVLKLIRPGTSKKGIVEEMNAFAFTGTMLATFNDKISIAHPFKSDFECLVPADNFLSCLQHCSSEDILIELSENELIIEDKKYKAAIKILGGDINKQLPWLSIDEFKWKKLPENFMEGINLCSFSAAKDTSVAFLSCVAVLIDKIVSSDNYRISKFKLKESLELNTLIPANSVMELCKLPNITHFHFNDTWIFFKGTDGVMFCSRVVEAKFPDVNNLFSVEGKKIRIPDDMKNAIEACTPFIEDIEIDARVLVSVAEKTIRCRSENDHGWAEYQLDTDSEINDMEFQINPVFFRHILNHATMMTIGDGKVLFRSGAFQHVIALGGGKK